MLDREWKYKRALAESENLRKRLTKQIDEAKIYGIQSFCKDLLEVTYISVHKNLGCLWKRGILKI